MSGCGGSLDRTYDSTIIVGVQSAKSTTTQLSCSTINRILQLRPLAPRHPGAIQLDRISDDYTLR